MHILSISFEAKLSDVVLFHWASTNIWPEPTIWKANIQDNYPSLNNINNNSIIYIRQLNKTRINVFILGLSCYIGALLYGLRTTYHCTYIVPSKGHIYLPFATDNQRLCYAANTSIICFSANDALRQCHAGTDRLVSPALGRVFTLALRTSQNSPGTARCFALSISLHAFVESGRCLSVCVARVDHRQRQDTNTRGRCAMTYMIY